MDKKKIDIKSPVLQQKGQLQRINQKNVDFKNLHNNTKLK